MSKKIIKDCCKDSTYHDYEHWKQNRGLYCLGCGRKLWPIKTIEDKKNE